MNIDEVKSTIRQGNRAARDGRESIERTLRQARSAGIAARQATHDSKHPKVTEIGQGVSAVEQEAEVVLRRFQTAVENAEAYLERIS